MRNVYLINLSFGLAGIERRFANIWRALYGRGVVFPILVIPSALALLLEQANRLPHDSKGLIVIPEPRPVSLAAQLPMPHQLDVPVAIVRSRIAALGYRPVWRRIASDPGAIVHVGLNVSALRPPDVPSVYECVDSTLQQLGGRHYRRASTRRCIVHCQTDRIRTALESEFEGKPTRWRTVTSPMYFAEYGPPVGDQPRDPGLVVFVGRLDEWKNPLMFIEALAIAKARGVAFRAVMLGEGPLREACQNLIRERGLEADVTIQFVPKPFDIIRNASLFVTLQEGDNYGSQSLLEAMGAGCAVIASDVGQTKNIVTDDVGMRVRLDAESVAGALVAMLSQPDRTRKLGERAEYVARTQYSADAYAAFLESLYESAAAYHRADTT